MRPRSLLRRGVQAPHGALAVAGPPSPQDRRRGAAQAAARDGGGGTGRRPGPVAFAGRGRGHPAAGRAAARAPYPPAPAGRLARRPLAAVLTVLARGITPGAPLPHARASLRPTLACAIPRRA